MSCQYSWNLRLETARATKSHSPNLEQKHHGPKLGKAWVTVAGWGVIQK